MRVVEISPYASPQTSGVAAMVHDLGQEFNAHGHPTSILVPLEEHASADSDPERVRSRPTGSLLDLRFSAMVFASLFRKRRSWDLVHVHQAHPASLTAALLARDLGRPAVLTVHVRPHADFGLRAAFQSFLDWAVPRVCTSTVYVSEKTRRSSLGNGKVIRNGVAVARIRGSLGHRESIRNELRLDGFVVAFLGRHEKAKGFLDLIRAIRLLRDRGIDARLLAIGNTPVAEAGEVAHLVEEEQLRPFIIDVGQRRDRLRYFSAADVVALPSYQEGLPLSLLEAMAAGLPVVATTVGGIPEVVENGRQGYLIPPGDVRGLAEVLFKLSMSPAERKTLGHNALERAQAFDLAGVVSEYLRLFERITTR